MKKLSICLTHDVDRVRKTYHYLTHDLRRGRFRNLAEWFRQGDPYWNFEKIMSLEDRYGARSTWFFLEESIPFQPLRPKTWKLSLGRYSVREKAIAEIMRSMDGDGFEVGLHGSYRSFRDGALLKHEKNIIEGVLEKPIFGVRQHYLNLDVPDTWRLQREAGLKYDASYGYRRGLGWRRNRLEPFLDDTSGLWVLPLTIMECNLFTEAAGDPERAWEVALEIMDQAEEQKAVLSVLWHPHVYSEADFPGYGDVYEKILKEGKARGAEFLTAGEIVARRAVRVESN